MYGHTQQAIGGRSLKVPAYPLVLVLLSASSFAVT